MNQGITLIALVITIIILLILAGITIGTLMGENGILTKAKQAQEETQKAQYKEEIELIIMEKQMEKLHNINESKTLIELVAEGIRQKEWQENTTICDDQENDNIDPAEGTTIVVETKDGYEIIVKIDNKNMTGEVESITKGTSPTWKVTFDKNKGEGTEPKPIETRFGIVLPEPTDLSKSGYKFVGWSEDKEAKENGTIFLPRKHL